MNAKTNNQNYKLKGLIGDIEDELVRIEKSIETIKKQTVRIKNATDTLSEELFNVGSSIGRSYSSIHEFNLSAVGHTQDVELIISETLLSKLAVDVIKLDSIKVDYGGHKIVATPISQPKLGWKDIDIKKDCLHIDYELCITIDNALVKNCIMRIFLAFSVNGMKDSLSLIQTNAPRFYELGSNPHPTDPVKQFPIPINQRKLIREKIYDKIAEKLSIIRIQIPQIRSGEIDLKITPYTFAIREDIVLFDRHLPKRRQQLPLSSSLQDPYNMMLRIKEEHLEQLIKDKAKKINPHVYRTDLSFQEGYISLKVSYETVDYVTIVGISYKVIVTVYIDYKLTIEQERDKPSKLFIKLEMERYRYNINVEPCDILCNMIRDEAGKKIEEEIQNYKLLTFPFCDFSLIARLAFARIEPYGLQILLKHSVRWYQEQIVYDAVMNVRALPGYTVWQSFTVDFKGTLIEIDVGFVNDIKGIFILEIFQGIGPEDPNAKVLQTITVPVRSEGPCLNWNKWKVSVPVQAGERYFFRFSPEFNVNGKTNIPDPYRVAIGSNNPYPGGEMGEGDAFDITLPDMVFRIYGWEASR